MAKTSPFDKRRTLARGDLAASSLRGQVEAERFVEGQRRKIIAPVADLKSAPAPDAALDTQALYGEIFTVYEEEEGWAWGQLSGDSYVGYIAAAALGPESAAATHRVGVRATFIYPSLTIKAPVIAALPFWSEVTIVEMAGDFLREENGGFIFAKHLEPVGWHFDDYVSVAESMIGAPYLWGGKTPSGLDCSGLVQLALTAAGKCAPRDADMQAEELGRALPITEDLAGLQRGDLVFWKGHVGVMQNADWLLHANGFHMNVASERLHGACARIAKNSFGAITSLRRLD